MITSTLVIAEAHGWFLRRYDRNRALQFLACVEVMTPLQIHGVDRHDQEASVHLLRQFSDQNLTLTDAMGLHLMQRLDIRQCWSTDFHLGLTGVPLVIHT